MGNLNGYFGIDFGTTNSATICNLEGVKPRRYGDEEGNPFPSLVVIDKITGEVFCGRAAWERRRELSQTCEIIHSVKDYLGTSKSWKVAGKTWTPEEIAGLILRGIKEVVDKKDGGRFQLDEAVISVPVGFSAEKRKALRCAAKIADIKVKSFISESTSAIIKRYEEVKKYSKIAIFDWGGGTLDVSIVENNKGRINELGVAGLKLGGDDIDLKIAKWAHSQIVDKYGLEYAFEDMDPTFQDMLLVKSEIAKRDLCDLDDIVIAINKYGMQRFVRVSLDIDTFDRIIEKEVNEAISTLEKAVANAGLKLFEVECILMVGGSSNLRPLLERVDERWDELNVIYPENSEWDVAEGAAILSAKPGSFKLNQDIGVLLSDDTFFPIVSKDSVLPVKDVVQSFGIVEDTRDARFIFTDNTVNNDTKNKNILGILSVPTYGFWKEQLKLNAKINEDLIFEVDIKSDRKSENQSKNWSYTQLKFYYDVNSEVREWENEIEYYSYK